MSYRVIISGGGTGGHIYPALAIAHQIQAIVPESDILFVGAQGRMEMEKVPQAGFKIEGLPVAGIQRRLTLGNVWKNLLVPYKFVQSLLQALHILRTFKPHVVVGVGGYASGPVLISAQYLRLPTLIQEQNSYAGITNKFLGKYAMKVCVAYPDMKRYFPENKIVYTGNPVRKDILDAHLLKLPGCTFFKMDPAKKIVLVLGGSLGATSINKAMEACVSSLLSQEIQVLWQCGKNYDIPPHFSNQKGLVITHFIREMHWAYGMADVVISRAGALSISELSLVAKPCILVPSPNVAEDHQTKNALELADKQAAILLPDNQLNHKLLDTILKLLSLPSWCEQLSTNIKQFAHPNAASDIVRCILDISRKPHPQESGTQ